MDSFWIEVRDNFQLSDLEIKEITYTLICRSIGLSRAIIMFFIFLLFKSQYKYLLCTCIMYCLYKLPVSRDIRQYLSHTAHFFFIVLLSIYLLPSILTFIISNLNIYASTMHTIIIFFCFLITYLITFLPYTYISETQILNIQAQRYKLLLIYSIILSTIIILPDFKYPDVAVCTLMVYTLQTTYKNWKEIIKSHR